MSRVLDSLYHVTGWVLAHPRVWLLYEGDLAPIPIKYAMAQTSEVLAEASDMLGQDFRSLRSALDLALVLRFPRRNPQELDRFAILVLGHHVGAEYL